MKKVIVFSAVIAVVIMLFTTAIYSQPADNSRRGHGPNSSSFRDGKGFGLLFDKLNLTDSQKDKINSLRTEHQKKMIDLRADLQKARLDEKELRNSDNISRSDVVKVTEKINKIRDEISLLRANHRMDIYEVLTPEQKKIAKDMKNNFSMNKQWHKKGMGKKTGCF